MNFRNILLSAAAALALASCSGPKATLTYFSDIETADEGTLPAMNYMPRLEPDDELSITVTSESPEATAIYNLPAVNPATRGTLTTATNPRTGTYVVDSKGDIDFPVLGTVHVGGMTCEQLKDYLTGRLSADVTDPYVSVALVNFKVSVGGEVKNPKTLPVSGNRITVLDALAAAGDMTEYGERENVLVIREENGERKFARLNLNSSDALTSPYYYLKQNDYVYVAPNSIRAANSKYNQNNAYKLSVTSTIVSAASVIASLVIALTVK